MRRAILLLALCLSSLAWGEIPMGSEDMGPFVLAGPDVAVAVVRKRDGKAEFYRTAWHTEPFASVPVGFNATHAAAKRWKQTPLLVVASSADMLIYVVDAKRGEVIARPTVGGTVTSLAVDARDNSPYVYYAIAPTDPRRESKRIGRINVENGRDEGLLDSSFVTNASLELSITDAADLIYAKLSNGTTSVVGLRVDEPAEKGQKARLTTVFTRDQATQELFINPLGVGAAIQNDYYDRELTRVVSRFYKEPACFLHRQNVFLSIEGVLLVARSANNMRVLGHVEPRLYMPPSKSPLRPDTAPDQGPKADATGGRVPNAYDVPVVPIQFAPRNRQGAELEPLDIVGKCPVVVDEDRRLVLVRHAHGVLAIPLDHFGVLDEPTLGSRLTSAVEGIVSEEIVVDLQLADPATQVEIKEGPEGLLVKDGKLNWTPAGKQVGLHVISLRLSLKDVAIQHSLDIEVRHRSIVLPIHTQQLAFTPDGSKVICFEPPSSQSPAPKDTANGRLAVVDAKTMKVEGVYLPPSTITHWVVHDKYAFVSVGTAGAVKVLSLPTLQEQGQLFASDRIKAMWVAGEYLGVQVHQTATEWDTTWYAIDTLKPIELPPYKLFPRWVRQGKMTDQTVEFRGVVYDVKSLKPIGLAAPQHMISVGQRISGDSEGFPIRFNHGWAQRYGRIVRWDWSPVEPSNEYGNALAPDRPAFLTAFFDEDEHRPVVKRRARLCVALRAMTTTNERAKLVLHEMDSRYAAHPSNSAIPVAAGPGRFAVALGPRLFVVPTDEFGVDKLRDPLEAIVPTSRLFIPAGDATKLDLAATGGVGPYTWELVDAIPGITVVNGNALEVDPMSFAAGAKRSIMVGVTNFSSEKPLRGPREQYQAYADEYREILNQSFGLEVKQFPVAASLRLRVTDAANNTLVVPWTLIVEVPQQALSDELSAAQKAFDRNFPERTSGNGIAPIPKSANAELEALRRRVADLEAENAKLRGKVEALREVIDKQKK